MIRNSPRTSCAIRQNLGRLQAHVAQPTQASMLAALHRSRLSAPFLEHSTSRSNGADVDQVLTAVAKDVSFAAGGTAEAELCEGGAAVFDGTCSIAESQLHGSNVSPCASPAGLRCFDSTLCCLALLW